MSDDMKYKIIEEAKHLEEDSYYSSKRQFEAAKSWKKFHFYVGVPSVLFAALAAASAFLQFESHDLIVGILAVTVTAFTALTTFLNPIEKAYSLRVIGNKFNSLKSKAHIFYVIDCIGNSSNQELTQKFKALAKENDELNQVSPLAPKYIYNKTKREIIEKNADPDHNKNKAA